ncbi:MAG TPA: DUF429 domain-containing protein [Kofleriaceae bacterium]|jgi:predicted RNase H-like nuclease
MIVLGVDLAWAEATRSGHANETGVVAATQDGTIVDAGWTVGIEQTLDWIGVNAADDVLAMIDAPLVVDNAKGQRLCEKQVGQRYGRWKVSANTTNLSSPRLGGVALRERLESSGWSYDSGLSGPPSTGRRFSECYPYTCLVGAEELGYDDERPVYKRKPKRMPAAEFRVARAKNCDELLRRLDALSTANPPLRLRSHPTTEALLSTPSPLNDRDYKHREDLIDAAVSAWTGLLWLTHGTTRVQVLGDTSSAAPPTIIAPARPTQR